MSLYRIFTQDVNRSTVEKIVAKHFPGFTLIKADGYWKLIREGTLIIEIEAPDVERAQVEAVATEIKEANAQESVLIQKIENSSWLV